MNPKKELEMITLETIALSGPFHRTKIALVEERPDVWLGFPVTWSDSQRDWWGYLTYPKCSYRRIEE
jgi:hypothetical protein